MRRARTADVSALTLALALTAALPVVAQDDTAREESSEELEMREVIIVTAQKREESVLEVPINITAYSGTFLDEIGVTEFNELAAFVPGLTVQEQSVNNPGFVIRGITSDSGAANIEPRVSIFQDGVSVSRSRGSIVQLFDIDRIEVLKGPQGTLFGRSAQIGAVSVFTKRAEFETGYGVSAEFGNFSQAEIEGYANIGLIEEELAVRLSGVYTHRDGYIENNTGVDLNGTETAAFRVSTRWEPTDNLRFDVIFNYQHDTPPGTSFKSGVIPALNGNTDPNDDASLNTFGNFLGGKPLSVDRELWGVTTIAQWDISDRWSLTNIAAYREFDSLEIFDPDGTAFDIFIFAEDAVGEQWSEELRLNYEGDWLRGFFGGGIFHEEGNQFVPLGFDERATLALFSLADPSIGSLLLTGDPAALEPFLTGVSPFNLLKPFHLEQFTNFADNTAYDIFAEITTEVLPELELTAGGRWTRDVKESFYSGGFLNGPSAIGQLGILSGGFPIPTLLVADTANRPVSSGQETFDAFVWRFVANYTVADNINAYASYSRGRRPEVIQEITSGPVLVGFEIIPAELVDSYEAGIKGLFFNGRLQAEGSIYYYEYENFQTSITDLTTGLIETINAGTADAIGVEVQLVATVLDGLDVYTTYGYSRARFDDEDEDGNPLIFGGEQFRLSPDHTFSIAALYERPVHDYGTIFVTPTFTWQSQIFFENPNSDQISEDAYGLLNVRAGWRAPSERFEVMVYVENALDKEYIIDAGNTGGAFGVPTFIAGPPRFYGGRVSAKF